MTFSLVNNPIWYLVKRNGEPAAGGKLFITLANNKSQPSPFYKDSGGLDPWPNPIVFGDSSATQGQFYGEDGVLYYLRAVDADNNELWTVDNFLPPAASGGSPTINYFDNVNYFRNSDFRDNFFPGTTKNMQAITAETQVAAGGWAFKKNNTSGTDSIGFVKFTAGQTDVPLDPLYYINYICTGTGTSEAKYIRYRFPNVYTFAGEAISIALQGISTSTSTITIDCLQHFGTGGSPAIDVPTPLTTVPLTATWTRYEKNNLIIPSISGKGIGTNDDSYLEIRFGLPANVTCNIGLTQLQIELGTTVQQYEYEDHYLGRYRTTGGELPGINIGSLTGQTDYMTPEFNPEGGMTLYGGAVPVGSIIMHCTDTDPAGYIKANGSTHNLIGTDKAYTRLHDVIGQRYGVGDDGYYFFYAKTTTTVSDDTIYATTSDGGVSSAPVDDGSGFTFTVEETGKVATLNLALYRFTSVNVNHVLFQCKDGNGAFVYGALHSAPTVGNVSGLVLESYIEGTSFISPSFRFSFPASSLITGGHYFLIANTSISYYVWYKKDGVGTDPAIAGKTGIEVNVLTGDSNFVVAQKTLDSIAGRSRVKITCLAESAITAGNGFDIFNGTEALRVWYSIGGTGTKPAEPTSKLLLEIALTGGETATQVAAATQTAMSAIQFQVPDLRGLFPRFADLGSTVDPDANTRYSSDRTQNTTEGNYIGSKQDMSIQSHRHEPESGSGFLVYGAGSGAEGGGGSVGGNDYTSFVGDKETRPTNVYLAAYIKY